MRHNEDTRVKVPALIHFSRLGYSYQPKAGANINGTNNIFPDILKESLERINGLTLSSDRVDRIISEIAELTNNERDKGKRFYEVLTSQAGLKWIDLKCPENNDFRVVSELQYTPSLGPGFRPDITILINGIPLAYLEVKKPNNQEGIQQEFRRERERGNNPEYRSYLNQIQIVACTNNMEYDDEEKIKKSGSFYTTPNGKRLSFNSFREEEPIGVSEFIDEQRQHEVLVDTGMLGIEQTEEYLTNLHSNTPCNRFITSLFTKERIIRFIRYGLAYVESQQEGMSKHIARYPQFFALYKIEKEAEKSLHNRVQEKNTRGIIWHTQGSGKTALAYFATNVLRDFYAKSGIVSRFYFIVDRLDLLEQAQSEFSARGMTIEPIQSREAFVQNLKSVDRVGYSRTGGNYKETMNVVNIQKFSESAVVDEDIRADIQRIYFVDEVHRGYKRSGQFLANLFGADREGLFIGLTGTPILTEEFNSTEIFDHYIHTYYYNKSIADGYTLKIRKENISTHLRKQIRGIINQGRDEQSNTISEQDWERFGRLDTFVEQIGYYINKDFSDFISNREFRTFSDELGFMIVASSTEQAEKLHKWFEGNSSLRTALVLHDEDNNPQKREAFKGYESENRPGKIESPYDGVIVLHMLLTGYDAKRLKRMYLLKRKRDHTLLQTLARVNRPFKEMRYGYVVDFVDITEEYEETHKKYLRELQNEIGTVDQIGDEADVEALFVNTDEVRVQLRSTQRELFRFMPNIEHNLEQFRLQAQHLENDELYKLRGQLETYRQCYNDLRMAFEDVSSMPVDRIYAALREVENIVRYRRFVNDFEDEEGITDEQFEQYLFEFLKTGESDLNFTTEDDIFEIVPKIRSEILVNLDQEDPVLKGMRVEFRNLLHRFRNQQTSDEVQETKQELNLLLNRLIALNQENQALLRHYHGDEDLMRIHKRIREVFGDNMDDFSINESLIVVGTHLNNILSRLDVDRSYLSQDLRRPTWAAFNKHTELSMSQVMEIIDLIIKEKFAI